MQPKISVIMPVYNSERYLSNAINSVLNQTFEDIELILIDDGSRDGSGLICDKFQSEDCRVRVIHQQNGGRCMARNVGLDLAKGKYVTFIDNDDLYSSNLLLDNYKIAEKWGADIVQYGYIEKKVINDKMISEVKYSFPNFKTIHADELAENLGPFFSNITHRSVWNALYNKDFLDANKIRFSINLRVGYEDLDFNLKCFPHIKLMVLNPGTYYNWLVRDGHSGSTKFSREGFTTIFSILNTELEILNQFNGEYALRNSILARGLAAYLGFICHTKSDLTYKEKIQYLNEFKGCFGIIGNAGIENTRYKLYAFLYNHSMYRGLLHVKQSVNLAKRLSEFIKHPNN